MDTAVKEKHTVRLYSAAIGQKQIDARCPGCICAVRKKGLLLWKQTGQRRIAGDCGRNAERLAGIANGKEQAWTLI